jgi:hypothetical protein
MKKSSGITEIKSRTSFSKKMLRKFVNNQTVNKAWTVKAGKKGERFSANYDTIAWSSTLLPLDGTLEILFDAKHPEAVSRISMPVQVAFLVTCTKKDDNYKVTWSCSMS